MIAKLKTYVLDAPDIAALSAFYGGLAGSAEAAALAIGATRLPGNGDNWRVYADPVGKPFCLTWQD